MQVGGGSSGTGLLSGQKREGLVGLGICPVCQEGRAPCLGAGAEWACVERGVWVHLPGAGTLHSEAMVGQGLNIYPHALTRLSRLSVTLSIIW